MMIALRKGVAPILLLLASVCTGTICASAFSAGPSQVKLALTKSNNGLDLDHTPIESLIKRRWGNQGNQGGVSMSSSSGDGASDEKKVSFAAQVGDVLADPKNFLPIGMVVAVCLAGAFPELGRTGGLLRPELFISKFGVTLIFLISGLSLKSSDLSKAATSYKLNSLITLTTFVGWPFLVGVPVTKLLETCIPTLIPKALVDGLLILTCLPTTISSCVNMTISAGGSVASALFNACISNILGIFITPALVFRFFGASIELPFVDMTLKLCKKVLVPVAIGQALRATRMKEVHDSNKGFFKRLQDLLLLGIVWNSFCDAFTKGLGLGIKHTVFMLTLLSTLHIGSLAASFASFKALNFSKKEVVAAMFVASQKTLALGLPLIKLIFEGSPNLVAYSAPIMLMHPLQNFIDGFLAGKVLKPYTEDEEKDE